MTYGCATLRFHASELESEISPKLIARTVQGIADIRSSEEGKEGVQSFLQKRKPSWLA